MGDEETAEPAVEKVVPEKAALQESEVENLIEKLTHDKDETQEQYDADLNETIKKLIRGYNAREYETHNHPDKFRRWIDHIRQKLMGGLYSQYYQEADMIGDHARIWREAFAHHIPQLLVELNAIKKEMIEQQAAVEHVQESDPVWTEKDSDEIVDYLIESSFHLKLKPDQSYAELKAEIDRAMQYAEITEDHEKLAEILAKTEVLTGSTDTITSERFTKLLANALTTTYMTRPRQKLRRNWFIRAGLPLETVAPRQVRLKLKPHRPPEAPRPSAQMDDGARLLPPPPKKGAQGGERDMAGMTHDQYHKLRDGYVSDLLKLDTTGDGQRSKYFQKDRTIVRGHLVRTGRQIKFAQNWSAENPKFMALVDRNRNPAWAELEHRMMGNRFDAHADMWAEVLDRYQHAGRTGTFPKNKKGFGPNHDASREQILRLMQDEPDHHGFRVDRDTVLGRLVRGTVGPQGAQGQVDPTDPHLHAILDKLEELDRLNNTYLLHNPFGGVMRSGAITAMERHPTPQTKMHFNHLRFETGLANNAELTKTYPHWKVFRNDRPQEGRTESNFLGHEEHVANATRVPIIDYFNETRGFTDLKEVEREHPTILTGINQSMPDHYMKLRHKKSGIGSNDFAKTHQERARDKQRARETARISLPDSPEVSPSPFESKRPPPQLRLDAEEAREGSVDTIDMTQDQDEEEEVRMPSLEAPSEPPIPEDPARQAQEYIEGIIRPWLPDTRPDDGSDPWAVAALGAIAHLGDHMHEKLRRELVRRYKLPVAPSRLSPKDKLAKDKHDRERDAAVASLTTNLNKARASHMAIYKKLGNSVPHAGDPGYKAWVHAKEQEDRFRAARLEVLSRVYRPEPPRMKGPSAVRSSSDSDSSRSSTAPPLPQIPMPSLEAPSEPSEPDEKSPEVATAAPVRRKLGARDFPREDYAIMEQLFLEVLESNPMDTRDVWDDIVENQLRQGVSPAYYKKAVEWGENMVRDLEYHGWDADDRSITTASSDRPILPRTISPYERPASRRRPDRTPSSSTVTTVDDDEKSVIAPTGDEIGNFAGFPVWDPRPSEEASTVSMASSHDIGVLHPHLPPVPALPRRQVPEHVRRGYRNVVHSQIMRPAGGFMGAERGLPIHGRVHLVRMSNVAGDDHFMHELVEDANLGRRRVQTSRKGPFRGTSGHIKAMARSTHVVYRVRGHVIQITVYRGVLKRELDVLVGKLGAHRISTKKTICMLVVKGRKRKLGDLQTLNLDALRGAIVRSLSTSKSVGISLHDIGKEGSLHRQHRPEREYV